MLWNWQQGMGRRVISIFRNIIIEKAASSKAHGPQKHLPDCLSHLFSVISPYVCATQLCLSVQLTPILQLIK